MLPECPVCGASPTITLAERPQFPMFVNMVRATREDARSVARGDVTFVACGDCGHVWNRTFEPDKLIFDPSYNPDQIGSPAFDRHIADVADRIARSCSHLDTIDLLEIGCGQGDFLQQMIDRMGDRVKTARGYDPAFWTGKPRFRDSRIHVERAYFDDDAVKSFVGKANVVISRQAVQHVPYPRGFYKNVRSVMGENGARLFVEAPDVTYIFEHKTTYDLFYEHCCLYSPSSIARALRDAGFAVSAVEPAFGGQYLVAFASTDSGAGAFATPSPRSPAGLLDADRAFVSTWKKKLADARTRGPVYVWGAGAKGASFALMVDPAGEALSGIIDINPTKQGKFVPGTGHAILSPTDRAVALAKTIVISNAIYTDEITAKLRAIGCDADVWTLDDR